MHLSSLYIYINFKGKRYLLVRGIDVWLIGDKVLRWSCDVGSKKLQIWKIWCGLLFNLKNTVESCWTKWEESSVGPLIVFFFDMILVSDMETESSHPILVWDGHLSVLASRQKEQTGKFSILAAHIYGYPSQNNLKSNSKGPVDFGLYWVRLLLTYPSP